MQIKYSSSINVQHLCVAVYETLCVYLCVLFGAGFSSNPIWLEQYENGWPVQQDSDTDR